jgi:hypothetical protein
MPGARPAEPPQQPKGANRPQQQRISTPKLVLIAVLATVGMLGWWFWKNPPADPNAAASASASPAASAQPNKFGPAVVPLSRMKGLPAELGHPVYWAGEIPGKAYQLVIAADGAVGLRYLDPESDERKQRAITVATQPNPDAYQLAKDNHKALFPSAKSGPASTSPSPSSSTLVRAQVNPDGSLVFLDGASTFVGHLVHPDLPYLISVYAPEPGQAWQLLSSGAIAPIPN